MHTLFDFISNVNAMQYGLALFFILGFIIFYEILKPKPFEGLLKSAADDVKFIKAQRKETSVQLIKKIALAPMYILFYLAAVPVLFVQGFSIPLGKGIATVTSAGWSPVRAYFTGSRKAKKAQGNDPGQQTNRL
ncbi:MAG: hypothetical protein HY755_09660 [Nitrospirae bacterium]|nr:hypothetical protein [Nitrospirota bacterium]